ncbi:MAG: DUF1592 domain-containing protein [Armatimonadota bacterium]
MQSRRPPLPARPLAAGLTLLVALSGALAAAPARPRRAPAPARKAAPALTGEQVYRQQCASCHGAKGEGTTKYGKPLVGTQSVGQLAQFIRKTMPPGPKKCSAPHAQKVAEYIHHAFYSPLAQARNKPARVELSRLTVRQYRHAVTDLIGSFRPAPARDERRGLRAEYFKGRRLRGEDRVTERIDPEVRFDFGTNGPEPEKFDPYEFSIRWSGSVVAPETGEYEFVLRSDHAARLWVNDRQEPLIDAWVRSGSDTEFRGSLFLLGGRAYPVRLEFSKAKQGVDDSDKNKQRPVPPASVGLLWRLPHRAVETIPSRNLLPVGMPETFVPATPFPPDDRSVGYERGTSISKEWESATTDAAIETANYVVEHLNELAGGGNDPAERQKRIREFCRQLAERAFRRPLTPELEQLYVDRQLQQTADPEVSVKRVVLLVLKSPRFLYREVGAETPDAYQVAARLAFGLWDSLPDTELLKAAAAGELSTPEQVTRQAERMVADPRAWSKLRDFLLQWLKVDHSPELAKDARRYPGFDDAVAADLRTSLELFLEQTAWGERSDYRELLLSERFPLNGRLAKLYGVDLPADAPFQPVALDPKERAGVLTHPYLLSSFAYLDASSPIHRGVLIARSLLGRTLMPPPEAVSPIAADVHPNLTTRQRVDLQTKPAACRSCHDLINPLGFTLEKFDAIGRVRAQDNGRPVDATGGYQSRSGAEIKLRGARELAQYLAQSEESHGALVEQLFHYLIKQPVRAYGPQTLPELQRTFAANQYSLRRQMVESVTVAALAR